MTEERREQNNNTNILFSIENSRNRELGKQIRSEIDQLTKQFIELDDQENKILLSKKAIILELADKFERLQEIGEYPFPVNRIADGVLKHLQRNGYNISKTYVYEIIRDNAPQYISSSYDSVHSVPIDIKLYQQKIIEASDLTLNLKPELMTRDQIQDLLDKKYREIDILEDYASEHNILIQKDQLAAEAIPHYDAEELDPFKDPVLTDKPEPRISNLSQATHYLADCIAYLEKVVRANAKMMEQYPPDKDDEELEQKGANMLKEWGNWFKEGLATCFKSGTDRKYRRSIFEWIKIAEDENDWGKHAASSKNPYIARYRDAKTGEWKEEIRKLTREQIGDKSPKVRAFVKRFNQLIPHGISIIRWSEKNLNPYTNGESVKLGPKLSDRSLR